MKKDKKGIVFIPDISGYSRFVRQTKNKLGAQVISDLLQTIIRSNHLSLRISEIEGDAILFYQYGEAYPISMILDQYEKMLTAFNKRTKELAKLYPEIKFLSLKLIVHYGSIEEFSISGFCKLYGNTIVEAHRLLKNSIGSNTYALITKDYQNAQNDFDSYNAKQQCEVFNDGEKICYSYFSYQSHIKQSVIG